MRSVVRPEHDARKIFELCISSVKKNVNLKSRLESVVDDVEVAAEDYAQHAASASLHLVLKQKGLAGMVSGKEMEDVYVRRMVAQRSPGRRVYDELRALPDQGICPFCDHGVVSTLDHILPKSLYSALVVTPDNLVGSCRECNSNKLTSAPTRPESVPIHPYFDDLSNGQWLAAEVVEGRVPALVFSAKKVNTWPLKLNKRISRQFKELKLGKLYGSQGARVIAGQRLILENIFESRGMDGVREELQTSARSWKNYNVNCWQAVAFEALGNSDWYCGGGFLENGGT